MNITINGEVCEILRVQNWGGLPTVETDNGDFYLAKDSEHAGEQARKYWEDMAQNDPKEFTCIVGEETLVSWALGQWAGPGSDGATSLDGWLDLCADYPEEHFASCDGAEQEVQAICNVDPTHLQYLLDYDMEAKEVDDLLAQDVADEIGFIPTVAYRHN